MTRGAFDEVSLTELRRRASYKFRHPRAGFQLRAGLPPLQSSQSDRACLLAFRR